MSNIIFDNDLVAIRQSKVTLILNQPAYVRICILDLSKVLMYEFYYDYIKNRMVLNKVIIWFNTRLAQGYNRYGIRKQGYYSMTLIG